MCAPFLVWQPIGTVRPHSASEQSIMRRIRHTRGGSRASRCDDSTRRLRSEGCARVAAGGSFDPTWGAGTAAVLPLGQGKLIVPTGRPSMEQATGTSRRTHCSRCHPRLTLHPRLTIRTSAEQRRGSTPSSDWECFAARPRGLRDVKTSPFLQLLQCRIRLQMLRRSVRV